MFERPAYEATRREGVLPGAVSGDVYGSRSDCDVCYRLLDPHPWVGRPLRGAGTRASCGYGSPEDEACGPLGSVSWIGRPSCDPFGVGSSKVGRVAEGFTRHRLMQNRLVLVPKRSHPISVESLTLRYSSIDGPPMRTCPLRLTLLIPFVTSVSMASAIDAASVYAKAKGAVVTIRTNTGSGTGFVVGDGTLEVVSQPSSEA